MKSEEIDYSAPLECDVAIAGAELGGLVAGAILARAGRSVVVVDAPPLPGGRSGSYPHRGYWIDAGHRLGRDTADMQVTLDYTGRAAREAGVEVKVRPVRTGLRIHLVPGDDSTPPDVLEPADWGPEGFERLAVRGFGCAPEDLAEFNRTVERLGGTPPAERERAMGVQLGDWMEAEVPNPSVRRALGNLVKSLYSEFPERASLGRLMDMLAGFSQRDTEGGSQSGFADDPEVGGMGGASAPFARGLVEHGGRLVPEHEPAHVTFDGARATGLVALSANHFALRVRARHTIVAWPVWDALELLPPERVDPELARTSEALEDYRAIAIGWVAGLRRMPRVRATGLDEDFDGWNRLLVGPEREFSGGYHFPSLGSRRAAPEGRHLLHAFIMRWVRRGENRPWPELEATLERARAYVRTFYADLDECIEWQADQYVRRPAMTGWYWAPVKRHPVAVPGCENLYFAGATAESDAGPSEIAAHAGLRAARAILER